MNSHIPFDADNDWTLDPYHCNHSNDPLVDKLIGNAYHVVRTVYCNLGNLKLIYDFLQQYGMVLGVQSEIELKALTVSASYARIYDKTPAGDRQVTDYLYVEGDRTGILPDDTTATGSWVKVATSGSSSGGESTNDGGYIPWIYNSGSAIGGETTIRIPDETAGAPFMIVNGDWQTEGYDFEYDPVAFEVSFTTPLEPGDFVVVMRTGVPANPDNPNISDWVTINWLYNNGAAVGGEQVIDIPYTFQSVPAVYKNGLRFYKALSSESYTIDSDNNRIILTEPLSTNDRLIVQLGGEAQVLETVDRTIQEVARAANVKDSEVILSTDATQVLNGKKVVYDVLTQHIYGLPTLPHNVYINAVSNRQLTYSPGNITVTLLDSYQQQNTRELWRRSLAEAGLTLVDGSFEDGATANSATDAVWHIAAGQCYSWDGALPKIVSAGSTPSTTGGVGVGAWLAVGNALLRTVLSSIDGYDIVGKCESVAQLMTISGTRDGSRVLVNGYYAGTNVGGGEFSWDASTTSAADGGYIIRPAGVSQGAWVRVAKGNTVSISEYGVTGDSSDVSDKILSAFAMANMLQKEVNLDVDYRAKALVIDGYENVRVRGSGKGKLVDNCNKVLFTFMNCDGLDIYGIDLDGNRMNQTSTTQPGTPDGVGTLVIQQCNNWKVEHCDIHDNRLGAAVIIVDNGTNTSTNWEGSIHNGYFHKNYLHDNGVKGVVMSDGIFSWSHSTVISDNVIRRCTDYGIATDYSQRHIIKNNIISEVYVGVGVLGGRDVLVDGNNIDTCELAVAVALSGNPAVNPYISRNVTITNNRIRDVEEVTALGDGIYVDYSCEYAHVADNVVINAKRGVAVACAQSVVVNNTAIDCRLNSFFVESKQGSSANNTAIRYDGSGPAPSYFSGTSNKLFTGTGGTQEIVVRKTIGLSPVKIGEVLTNGVFAAAIVEVEFAGLINSFGGAVAVRSFSVKKSDTGYTIGELSRSGESTQVILEMNTLSGIPSIYVNWASGSETQTTVTVRVKSSGLQDDTMYFRTV